MEENPTNRTWCVTIVIVCCNPFTCGITHWGDLLITAIIHLRGPWDDPPVVHQPDGPWQTKWVLLKGRWNVRGKKHMCLKPPAKNIYNYNIYIYIYVCMCVCVYIYIIIYTYVPTLAQKSTHKCKYKCVCVCKYIHITCTYCVLIRTLWL